MSRILITGHPRSATMYTHKLLQTLGYNSKFEKRNINGFTVSWKHILTGEFEKPCPETNIICQFDKIIHQVRHPLKVIASSTSLWTMSMHYLRKVAKLPDEIKNKKNTIRNCMYTWVAWNKLIESKASWRYKIEDLSNILKEWCKQLEIHQMDSIPHIGKVNTRNHILLTWDDLFAIDINKAKEVRELAIKYGYKGE